MRTLTLEIQNESIVDKVIWMLNHFKSDGLSIKEDINNNSDITNSIKQAVDELNLVKNNNIQAKPIKNLLDAI